MLTTLFLSVILFFGYCERENAFEILYVSPTGTGTSCGTSDPCSLKSALGKISQESYSEVEVQAISGSYKIESESPVLHCSKFSFFAKTTDVTVELSSSKEAFLRFDRAVTVSLSKLTFSGIERKLLDSVNYPIELTISNTNFENGKIHIIDQRNGLKSLTLQSINVNDWSNGFIKIDRNEYDLTIDSSHTYFSNLTNTCPIQVYSAENKVIGTFSHFHLYYSQMIFHPASGLGFFTKSVTLTLSNVVIYGNNNYPIHLNTTEDTTLIIRGPSTFSNNFGFFGGSVYARSIRGAVNIDIQDTIMESNVAEFTGGFISISSRKPVKYISKNNHFTKNTCHFQGGSVYIEQVILDPTKPVELSDIQILNDHYELGYTERGVGGVVFISVGKLHLTVNNSVFINNMAGFPQLLPIGQGQYDGGVFKISTFDKATLDIHYSIFTNNTGKEGGVFFIDNVYVYDHVLRISHSNFTGNRAFDEDCEKQCQTGRGGVFFLQLTNGLSTNHSVAVQFELRDNAFIRNSALMHGVVVYIYENDNYCLYDVIMDNNLFLENDAWGNGGAVSFYESNGILTNNLFIRNVGGSNGMYQAFGGGISWKGGRSLVLGKGNVWDGNVVNYYGGGLSLVDIDHVEIHDDVRIQNNQAYNGGGLYIKNSGTDIDSEIRGNKASFGGGLTVDLASSQLSLTLHKLVTENTASDTGGGIYIIQGAGVDPDNLKKYVTGNEGSDLSGKPTSIETLPSHDEMTDYVCIRGGKDDYFWICDFKLLRFKDQFGDVLVGETMALFTLTIDFHNNRTIQFFTKETKDIQFSFLPQYEDMNSLSGIHDVTVTFDPTSNNNNNNNNNSVDIKIYFDSGNHGQKKKKKEKEKKNYMWIFYLCLILFLFCFCLCCLCCLTFIVCFNLIWKLRKSIQKNFPYEKIGESEKLENEDDDDDDSSRADYDDSDDVGNGNSIIINADNEHGYESL